MFWKKVKRAEPVILDTHVYLEREYPVFYNPTKFNTADCAVAAMISAALGGNFSAWGATLYSADFNMSIGVYRSTLTSFATKNAAHVWANGSIVIVLHGDECAAWATGEYALDLNDAGWMVSIREMVETLTTRANAEYAHANV